MSKNIRPLLMVLFLLVAITGCKKDQNEDTVDLQGTIWKSTTDKSVFSIKFIDQTSCGITTHSINSEIDDLNYEEMEYEMGFGIDLFIFKKSESEQKTVVYTGDFRDRNSLVLNNKVNEGEPAIERLLTRQE